MFMAVGAGRVRGMNENSATASATTSTWGTRSSTQATKTRFLAPLLLALGALLVGMVLSYIVGAFLPVTSAKEAPHVAWWLSVLTVIAFFVIYGGLTAALVWWSRRFGVGSPFELKRAVTVGVISGVFAVVASWIFEDLQAKIPGFFGGTEVGYWLTGVIEEGTKLLIPVVLMGTVAFRHVLTGFWAVFTSAATFGAFEGAMSYIENIYEPNPPVEGYTGAWMQAVNGLNLSGELHHDLYTAPAAALIWFAAANFSKGKAWGVGIAAFLGASLIHGFNDGVLGAWFDREGASDIDMANGIYIEFAFGILLLFTWYYLSVRKLRAPGVTEETVVR